MAILLLYGKNPILEALRAGRRKINHLFYSSTREDPFIEEVLELCEKSRIKNSKVAKDWFENKLPNVLTQGIAAEVEEFPHISFENLLSTVREKNHGIILALDQIQDPQNLGAILRTAECCGVDGVLIPSDRSTHITPAVCKASAGAVEYLSVSLVTNLARSLKQLKELGFWVVGTAVAEKSENLGSEEGQKAFPIQKIEDGLDFKWPEKTVLVLGSEGEGMRRLIKESCDFLIHLPLAGNIQSLNVSVAAAVCLFGYLKKYRNSKK